MMKKYFLIFSVLLSIHCTNTMDWLVPTGFFARICATVSGSNQILQTVNDSFIRGFDRSYPFPLVQSYQVSPVNIVDSILTYLSSCNMATHVMQQIHKFELDIKTITSPPLLQTYRQEVNA